MNDERNLVLNIVPKIDWEKIRQELSSFASSISVPLGSGSGSGASATTAAGTQATNSVGGTAAEIYQNQSAADAAAGTESSAKKTADSLDKLSKSLSAEDEAAKKQKLQLIQVASSAVSQTENTLKSFAKSSLGLIEDIYNRLKASSPLLQTIESLFQLAMTLFFMPLGNKLAEVLLPAVLELLDSVVNMWDSFEGKSLGEIFTYAFKTGISLLGEFFEEIGGLLEDEGGLLGSVGHMLTTIGNFLQTNGYEVLEKIFDVASWMVEHISTIIGLIVTFMGLHYTLMLAQMAVTATSTTVAGWLGAGTVVAGAASVAAGAAVTGILDGNFAMAEGGYVPATEGGQLHLLGEGGEGEYVVPESKLGSMGGTVNNYYNITGVTSDELQRMIRDTVNESVSNSMRRGSF